MADARDLGTATREQRHAGGAEAFAAFVSLCQTLGQGGIAPVAGLTALFRSGHLPAPPASR